MKTYDSRYSGHVDPDRTQAMRVQPGPSRLVAAALHRRMADFGATMDDIEEAVSRGCYSQIKLRNIADEALKIGSAIGRNVRIAVLSVLEDSLESKTDAQIIADLKKYCD